MNTNEQTEPTPRTDAVDAEIAKIIASNQSAKVSDLIAIAIGRLMRHTRTLERELNAATHRAQEAERERVEYEIKIINISCLGTAETQFNSVGEMQIAGLYKHKKELEHQLTSANEALKLAAGTLELVVGALGIIAKFSCLDSETKETILHLKTSAEKSLSHPAIQESLGKEGE